MAQPSPVLVISYNRPDYLSKVLESVVPQLGERRIALFQDGSWSDSLGKHKTDPELQDKCVSLFIEKFPFGEYFRSDKNIGTALNIDRAERYAFETLGADSAIFLEDDLVLGPAYFKVLESLIRLAMDDERIGYVAAFGNWRKTRDQQLASANKLQPMHLLWGFGLTKRHWLKCRPYVEKYLELVSGVDYEQRDHEKIRALTTKWGIKPGDTAQDRIKSFVTAIVGATKLNTEAAYGRYIGEEGINFNAEIYRKWGFGNTSFFSEPQTLDFDLASVNFDPWYSGNNIWALEDLPSKINNAVNSKSSFNELANVLFGENPYNGFEPIFSEPEFQNWNSTHPALTRLVKETKPHVIVELGVWKGLGAYTLAAAQKSVLPHGYLIAVDTFLGSPEHWDKARRPDVHAALRFKNGRPNLFDVFLSNMVLTGMHDRVLPLVQTSDNAALILKRNGICPDLIHVDAAHEYGPALRDIENYYDLLAPGGILIGDDWNWLEVAKAAIHFSDRMGLKVHVEHPKWWIRKPT
ncbi:hypothetical protein Rvan_2459 [Rhodomicrobium vannielii ATCC 17100]|uniref:Methyltransferase FkbM family n=1 Tax=Rhodomicrobium vannielii (strain ATCC 17100 / DSM 162 / LMG 4299 / NCIMB 10020 / ATH 3.1.1) TaxID=648757 RepID=E3I5F4_RHOVT|nr:class I SAM-dependent methyltransferase [Rhodomicrobium vannielii]ADP71675.1 hypothetical protein Rvan_2459 [Rhodomicrobium vannielii ATCC 17100]